MIKTTFLVFVYFTLILSACGPSESFIQTAIAQTNAAQPTVTLIPINTLTPTKTPLPTRTTTITQTFTSPPPPPATQTALAKVARKTENAKNATATQAEHIIRKTQTAIAKSEHATKVAPYKDIYWEDLAVYTDSHLWEKIKIRGKILNIPNNMQVQMQIGNSCVIALMKYPFVDLYSGQWITVYGTIKQTYCFKILDMEFCYPLLVDAFYEK